MPLRHILADLYPSEADIRRVLADADVDTERMVLSGSAVNMWTSVLADLDRRQQMGDLVWQVVKDFPDNNRLRTAINKQLVRREDTLTYQPDVERGRRVAGNGYSSRDILEEVRRDVRQLSERMDAFQRETQVEFATLKTQYRELSRDVTELNAFMSRLATFEREVYGLIDRRTITIATIVGLLLLAAMVTTIWITGGMTAAM